jgi:TfoX/Sxy family transcriptional regulator of competence genes
MSYDESLAERIRESLAQRRGIAERKMFGSLVFMLDGNMLVGVWKDSLIARLGRDATTDALAEEHVRVFDVTGRPMKGWVIVDPEGLDEDDQLKEWIERARSFVQTLPAK